MQKTIVALGEHPSLSVSLNRNVNNVSLGAVAARFICLALVVSIAPVCLYVDLKVLGNGVSEQSLTEILQVVFLFLSASSFVFIAAKKTEDRSFSLLAAAFFACMIVREMDAVFDLIAHGFWKYVAAPIAIIAIANGIKNSSSTLLGLSRFVRSQAGGLMLVAVAILLFYSRLIGMTIMWQSIMEDGYLRVVKNAVEETSELLGYSLILASSVRYLLHRLKSDS